MGKNKGYLYNGGIAFFLRNKKEPSGEYGSFFWFYNSYVKMMQFAVILSVFEL